MKALSVLLSASIALAILASGSPASSAQRTDWQKSLANANQALARNPKNADALHDRASALLNLERPDEALVDINAALKLDPADESYYGTRGEIELGLKKYSQALADFDKAISLDPDYGEFYFHRSKVQERMGNKDLAKLDLARATDLGYIDDQDIEFGPYMADLQRRIKKCWFPPKGDESKRVVVMFRILRAGDMSKLVIDQSSGVPAADAAALTAVKNAAPFRPLPKGSPLKVIIQFSFDYNVFTGGGHNSRGSGNSAPAAGCRQSTAAPDLKVFNYGSTAKTPAPELLEADLQKALVAAERAKGSNDASLVTPLLKLANSYNEHGKYLPAEALYQRALDILRKSSGHDLELALATGNLATVYAQQGKASEAESLFKQAIASMKSSGSGLTSGTREILTAYAKFLYKSSRFAEADEIYAIIKSGKLP